MGLGLRAADWSGLRLDKQPVSALLVVDVFNNAHVCVCVCVCVCVAGLLL